MGLPSPCSLLPGMHGNDSDNSAWSTPFPSPGFKQELDGCWSPEIKNEENNYFPEMSQYSPTFSQGPEYPDYRYPIPDTNSNSGMGLYPPQGFMAQDGWIISPAAMSATLEDTAGNDYFNYQPNDNEMT